MTRVNARLAWLHRDEQKVGAASEDSFPAKTVISATLRVNVELTKKGSQDMNDIFSRSLHLRQTNRLSTA